MNPERDSGPEPLEQASASGTTTDGFFRDLLDAAPEAMIVVGPDGLVVVVNTAAEKLFGYARDRLIGQPVELLLPARLRAAHRTHRQNYAGRPKSRSMGTGLELIALQSDGAEVPVEISLSPIETASGTLVVSAIRDVTERRRVHAELEQARRAAERANKANTAFLSAASHDLRQPVQALRLLNGALRRSVTDPLLLEMIESQQESLDAMTNLLNSLLDISRLDAGKLEPDVEEFPLDGVIGRLAAEFSRQARQKGLTFEAEPCEVSVRSDPDLLTRIIQNLVSNAVRYTPRGHVRLACTRHGDELSIEVSDTGIGIPAEELENIFIEFHQVRSDGRKREGVGLGLAITRRLADLLGHTITVRSTPGEGSCFSVRVPLASRSGSSEPASPRAAPRTAASAGFIVIVEDDVQVAKAWDRLLRTEGYRVACAATAAELRRLLEGLDGIPDLVLSDYHLLDGSNGIQAVQAIREATGRSIPAFIVTGDTSKVMQEAEQVANSRILSKPIGPDDLLVLARTAIADGISG